jgi:death-on-curing protein
MQQLRNRNALEGALARPKNYAHYRSADMALQAAVLAHGLAETQAFVEGNKRIALASMLTFIAVNGFDVNASQEELATWIIRLSDDLDADALALTLRTRIVASEVGSGPG